MGIKEYLLRDEVTIRLVISVEFDHVHECPLDQFLCTVLNSNSISTRLKSFKEKNPGVFFKFGFVFYVSLISYIYFGTIEWM